MKYYCSRFQSVEVQQTFYKPPTYSTALKRRQEAPKDFEFTIKAWQVITHPASSPTYRRAGLKIPPANSKHYGFFKLGHEILEAWEKTRDIAKALQAKVVMFQCPATLADCAEHAKTMRLFFGRLDRDDFIFVWQPRGRWSNKTVTALCHDLDLVHCADPLDKPHLYGSIKYFRLHGGRDYRHQHSDEELDRLKKNVNR